MSPDVLKAPPSRFWSRRKHRSVHLLEGEFADIDFLVDQANWLTELTVTAFVEDIGAVASLKQLRRLQLWPTADGTGSTWSVDLSSLRLLEHLSIGPGVRVEVGDNTRIGYLHVDHIKVELCDRIPEMQFLESLRLDSPDCLPSRIPGRVSELSIAVMRRWPETLRFSGMESLDFLQLENIRGMEDLSAFHGAPPIRRLYVEDCPNLSSIDGITLLDDAEYLFVGRTPLRKTMGSRWSQK